MANRESIRGPFARIEEESVRERAEWQDKLLDWVEAATFRPGTRLVRIDRNGSVRVYEGWRAVSIAETLDVCSRVDGDLWIGKSPRFSITGVVYNGHRTKDGAHRLWRQNNPEAARANSRLQAKKSRDRARVDWLEYCAAYEEKFPGTKPIGFDRWCRVGHRDAWLLKGAAGIVFNQAGGMRTDVTSDAQAGLAEKQRGPQAGE